VAELLLVRPMTRAGPIINIALLLLSVWTGYGSLDPDALRGTNPDKYVCVALLVVMPVFAFGAVSIRREAQHIERAFVATLFADLVA
jgi:hypothetical protein